MRRVRQVSGRSRVLESGLDRGIARHVLSGELQLVVLGARVHICPLTGTIGHWNVIAGPMS